jgi:hypothetical protein
MAVTVHEHTTELYIEIRGRFSGAGILQLQKEWQRAQLAQFWRQVVVDISGLTYCDSAGEGLLRCLLAHGCRFSARTVDSLYLLRRLSDSRDRQGSGGSAEEGHGVREFRPA